jgi:leader peptidase (prepilin peptidase)/N-methyltransferase
VEALAGGLTAAAVCLTLSGFLPFLLADEAGTRLLAARRPFSAVLAAAGIALAVLATLCWPGAGTRTGGTGVLLALALGAAAGATPFLVWIDVRLRRLPDRIVLPLAALLTVCLALAGAWSGLLTGLAGATALLVLSVIGGRGRGLAIGLGDVKLFYCLGCVTGLVSPLTAVGAFVIANLTGLVEACIRTLVLRQPLSSRFALGPHLLLGMWAAPLCVSVFPVPA